MKLNNLKKCCEKRSYRVRAAIICISISFGEKNANDRAEATPP